MKGKIVRLSCLLTFLLFGSARGVGQDTMRITLDEAEKQFLQYNFLLLAAKYQVSAADAAIIQAKLYPNPNFFVEQGVYNPETKKWFDLSSTGQTALALQQVIIL